MARILNIDLICINKGGVRVILRQNMSQNYDIKNIGALFSRTIVCSEYCKPNQAGNVRDRTLRFIFAHPAWAHFRLVLHWPVRRDTETVHELPENPGKSLAASPCARSTPRSTALANDS